MTPEELQLLITGLQAVPGLFAQLQQARAIASESDLAKLNAAAAAARASANAAVDQLDADLDKAEQE